MRPMTVVAELKLSLVVWVRPQYRRLNFLACIPLRSDPNSRPAAVTNAVVVAAVGVVVAAAAVGAVVGDGDDVQRLLVVELQRLLVAGAVG